MPDKPRYTIIPDWKDRKFKCNICGTTHNVKYKCRGNAYCSRCLLKVLN